MSIKAFLEPAGKWIVKNLPSILTALGIAGGVTATVIACKETPEYLEEKEDAEGVKEELIVFAKHYWPPIVIGSASAACLIAANRVGLKRQAAALAAYSLSQTNLKQYKDAVVQTFGEKKEEKIKDKVAENIVKENPPKESTIIYTGSGNSLCCDAVSGRYFRSNIEKIKQAVNEINRRLILENYIPLNDFYEEIGLEWIKLGDMLGWSMGSMHDTLEVSFSSQLTDDRCEFGEGIPCLVLNYEVHPGYWGE